MSWPSVGVLGRCRRAAGWSRRWWPDLVAEPAQLAVDAPVAPGRVLPGQPQHQPADLRRYSGSATLVRIGPSAPDQLPMPPQQRGWLDKQPTPVWARQQPRQSGQHRPVRPVDPRTSDVASQHRDLVAQHQRLGILGRRATRRQGKPSQQLAEGQMISRKAMPRSSRANRHRGELAAQGLRSSFWHPQVTTAWLEVPLAGLRRGSRYSPRPSTTRSRAAAR
jgi:hypothetical protein